MSEEKKELPSIVVQQNTGMILNTLEDVQRIGNVFIRSGMFPQNSIEKDLAAVCVKIIAGQELGLKPFQAMRGIDIIQGTPAFKYQVVGAKIKQSGRYDYSIIEATVSVAKIQFYENRKPVFLSIYTMADATTEGLASKDNYKKRPADMLFARALTKGANKVCPELFYGSCHAPEDFGYSSGDAVVTEASPDAEVTEAEAEAEETEIVEAVATKPPKPRNTKAGKPATTAVVETQTAATTAAAHSRPSGSTPSGQEPQNASTVTTTLPASEFGNASTAEPVSDPKPAASPAAAAENSPAQDDTSAAQETAAEQTSQAPAGAVATSKPALSLFRGKK